MIHPPPLLPLFSDTSFSYSLRSLLFPHWINVCSGLDLTEYLAYLSLCTMSSHFPLSLTLQYTDDLACPPDLSTSLPPMPFHLLAR